MLEVEESRRCGTLAPDTTLAIAVSRVGGGEGNEKIVSGTLAQLSTQSVDVFGQPLHSLVIVGKRLHHLEAQYAETFAVDPRLWRETATKVYGCTFD